MRVLLVEDEPIVARRLVRLLRDHAPEIVVLDTCTTLNDARRLLLGGRFDVVFLDLNLNGRDGFDLLSESAARSVAVVVVSAHPERAIEGFDEGIVDFVRKPFGAERIGTMVSRLRAHLAHRPAAALAVRSAGRVDLVPMADIAYVQAAGALSELILRDGTRRLHDVAIHQLGDMLPTFVRIHRSYLVPLANVARLRVREGSRYAVELTEGVELPVGRTRLDHVRARLLGEVC